MAKQPRISVSPQADYTARIWATHEGISTDALVSRLIISSAPKWIREAWHTRLAEAQRQIAFEPPGDSKEK